MIKWLMLGWVIVLLALHQDFWLWKDKYLVFGFLPIGLAYHAAYSVMAAITLFVLTKTVWPKHLDEEERALGDRPGASDAKSGGH